MAKFYGEIGFSITSEVRPGVWMPENVTRFYRGDVVRAGYNWQNANKVNDDLNISNQISVVADSFANKNLGYMKYVTYMGSKWKIQNITIEYPRIILTLGGLYNE